MNEVSSISRGSYDQPIAVRPHAGELPPARIFEDAGDADVSMDLRSVWSAIYRNRILIVIVVAIAIATGIAVTMLTTPIYQAIATIQIDTQSSRVLATQDVEPTQVTQDEDRFLQTQLDILRSRSLAERVGESLGLFRNNRFLLGMKLRVPTGVAVGPGASNAQRQAVIGALRTNVQVSLPRDSRVATITFDSADPAIAAQVANSFVDNFIIGNLQRKFDASSYARTFLQQQLADVKQRLEVSERAMIAYARGARLIDASNSAGTGTGGESSESAPRSLVTSSLVAMNTSLSGATATRVAAEERWRQAQLTPLMSLPEVQANSSIQDLIKERAVAAAEYQEQLQRRKEAFPTMQQAAAQIAELDHQITQLANTAKATIRDQYQVALKQEQALRGNLGELQNATLSEQDRSVRYNILRREVDTNRALYDGLLQRYKEVSAAAGIATNNVSVVDRADVPTGPILPRPFINLALAGIGGLLLSLLLIFARETFDDSIRSGEDVDRKLSVPFLGTVPVLPQGETPQSALANPRSALSEAYYALRSQLEFASPYGLARSLLCTSSLQGEGKSTTAVAIAGAFARIGKKVLLIDGDLRKPSLHKQLGLTNTVGFTNILTRQARFEDVVQHSETANLDLIPCGPLPPNPGELLAGAPLKELLAAVIGQYDLVLIDGPPVMGLADSPILSTMVDGTIFIVEASRAHRGQAKIALRRLRASNAVLLGAVLTKFDARLLGYGADYGYSYRYGNETTEKVKGAPVRFRVPGRGADGEVSS